MGSITITGAMIIITGWMTLIEFDHLSEAERERIIAQIKLRPLYLFIIALLPLGIIINITGNVIGSFVITVIGSAFIFFQSIMIALMLSRRTQWKGIVLFVIILLLGIVLYAPLILG